MSVLEHVDKPMEGGAARGKLRALGAPEQNKLIPVSQTPR